MMKHSPPPEKEHPALIYKKETFSKIGPIFAQYKWMLLAATGTYIMFNMIGLVMPWMLKISIDRILPNADYLLFGILCGLMVIIYLARFLLRYVAMYMVDYTGVRIVVDVRQKVFKHLQSLSLRFYQEYRTGKLISNMINDVALLNMLIRCVTQFGEQFFQLLLISVLLFFLNWQMALIILVTMPLHYLNFRYFQKVARKDYQSVQEKTSEISATLSESISGVKIVKSFAREHGESLRFFKTLRPIVELQMRVTVDGVMQASLSDILTVFTYLLTIGFGIRYVQTGLITIGEFVAFYSYVAMLLQPINIISSLSLTLSQGIVGASRIVGLMETIPEIKEAEHPVHPQKLTGKIEFDHVFFNYKKDNSVPTISDFTLNVRPGEKVALVGPSGSGKSTITNLLLRFYDVTGGAIRVDGIDVRRMGLESYRTQIGVVLQEPFLFSGTIRENIAYAKPDATEEEIEKAAELANVAEFVYGLPNGYDTVLGENGATLSGGQKQRLAIARAVLKNPSMLILDEATSALDTLSEALVQQALDRLMEGKTTIIIAHRLSTIQNADNIVVIDAGKIVQQGTHDELMSRNGVYRDLYEKQKKMAKGDIK